MDLSELSLRLRMLAVFRGLLSDPVVEELCTYLDSLENGFPQMMVSSYAELVCRLYEKGGGDLGLHIQRIVEEDENVYMRTAGLGQTPPAYMRQCVDMELETLQAAADLTPALLQEPLAGMEPLPDFGASRVGLAERYSRRVENVGQYGYGIYARHHMFYLNAQGKIVPVLHPDDNRLSDLVDYKREQEIILDNTRALLAGRPAANILLTGDAGTGKSSTVKAVANELHREGLRILEVRKEQLRDIPAILDELSVNPLKFILFIDDLSFQKDDENYSSLKAVLEGSVSMKSRNVAIYATSNRRHLVKEKFSDREGDDIHRNDTMQELMSLSERFGIHITFQKPNKATYLEIVHHLAEAGGIACGREELDLLAERYVLGRGGRSPRAARQFVDGLLSASRNTLSENFPGIR
ncbi:MAG: ATP-binding protein [Oscillospiraceae bacterium]|nr:ATP-binding protein [Oscillospiraceae bacterium]